MHASAQQPLPSAPPVNNPRWGALPRRQLLGALAKVCGACEGGAAPEDMLLLAQYSPASYSTNKTELLTELEVRLGRAGVGVGGCVRRVGGLSGWAVCTGVLVAPQQSAGVLLQPGRRTHPPPWPCRPAPATALSTPQARVSAIKEPGRGFFASSKTVLLAYRYPDAASGPRAPGKKLVLVAHK